MTKTKLVVLASIVLAAVWSVSAQTADTCASCHEEIVAGMHDNVHQRVRAFEVGGRAVGCEGCHTGAAQHAATGDPSQLALPQNPEEWNERCLGCHGKNKAAEWPSSAHASEGVACLDCHGVHKADEPAKACARCHADAVSQFQLPSHHPVREGHMTCASCHDVHSANRGALITNQRTNDLCYSCHQAKEGPFLFEHEPVQEDCQICHTPHGSVANNLLTANEPTVCLQCHDLHFHAGYKASVNPVVVGGETRTSGFGAQSYNVAFSTKCTQCHSQIHGSDLSSQSVTSGGRSLTR